MARLLPLGLLLLVLAPLAAAQPVPQVNETVQEKKSFLDDVLEGVDDTTSGVGDAVADVGRGAGSAAQAVGGALGAMARAMVAVAGDSVGLLASVGGGVAAGLGAASGAATDLLLASAAFLGAGAADALAAVAVAGVQGLVATVQGIGAVLLSYAGFVGGLRPGFVPMPAFVAVAGAGGAAAAGAGGWAGWQALRRWGLVGAGLGGLAGFTRIDAGELLEHPVREGIFQLIQGNPGIHASHIARQVGAGWGTVTHHLDKLEKGGIVTTRRVNNQKCYFENGGQVSRQDMAVAGALKTDTAAHIAKFVDAHPMTSQKRMAEALGISAALASFHVKKLCNLGVLEKVRHGKETLLTTSDALRRLLASEQSPAAALAVRPVEGMEFGS